MIYLNDLHFIFFPGTAYLFGKSIVTFDGKAIFLPRNWDTTYKDCKYILTRDFMWKNFTLTLHDGKLIVELKDGRIEIHKETGKVKIDYCRKGSFFERKNELALNIVLNYEIFP